MSLPTISFTSNGNSTHTAKVSFPEGDYSFSLSGTDLGGHKATISYNGAEANEYFFTSFNVDATKPKIQTNFKSFGADELKKGIIVRRGKKNYSKVILA